MIIAIRSCKSKHQREKGVKIQRSSPFECWNPIGMKVSVAYSINC